MSSYRAHLDERRVDFVFFFWGGEIMCLIWWISRWGMMGNDGEVEGLTPILNILNWSASSNSRPSLIEEARGFVV